MIFSSNQQVSNERHGKRRFLAVGTIDPSDVDNLRMYNVSDWSVVADAPTLPTIVSAFTRRMRFSRDGSLFAFGKDKRTSPSENAIRVYNTKPGWAQLNSVPSNSSSSVYSGLGETQGGIAFSPDGALIATATNNEFYVFRLSDWGLVNNGSLPFAAKGADFSPDGTLLAMVGTPTPSNLRVVRTENWANVSTVGATPPNIGSNSNDVAFSPDGTLLAVATDDTPFIRIFNTADWTQVSNPGTLPTGAAKGVSFSPDGTLLAVAHSTSPRVTIYNVPAWTKVANPGTLPTGDGKSVAFSGDGALLAVGHATSPFVTIYNVPAWTKVTNPSSLPIAAGTGVAFSY